VLAAAYGLTKSFTAVRILQILLGTASVGFIFLSAREWFGDRAAWIATGLAAFTGLFTFYEALILQASIDPFMTSAALLAVTYALKRGGPWWLIAGCIFGVETCCCSPAVSGPRSCSWRASSSAWRPRRFATASSHTSGRSSPRTAG
jgi:dolichyl-phosphate-mannose--protein O-mannosyl transferase